MSAGLAQPVRNRKFAPLEHRDDLAAFRAEIRAWLHAVTPADWHRTMRGATPEAYASFQRRWMNELREVGLATPHWPVDWGGEALSLQHQIIIYEEFARADAPDADMFVVSLYHLPATLFAHGTAAQQEKYLRGVQSGGDVWCQGFSEPGAGSDLAALRTRAELKGEVYILNGQKIWSSFGMFADYCLLLARTDPHATRKQAGISYFILDMKSPGITVRPIRQITGDAEFAEVFFDNVEIPVANLIGAENDGWRIAQSTLSAERGLIVFSLAERLERAFSRDLAAGRETWFRDAQFRREFVSLHTRMRAVRLLIRRMLLDMEAEPEKGDASITMFIKLYWATLLNDYGAFLLRVNGVAGNLAAQPILGGGFNTGAPINDYMKSFSWTISGGSNEIMRNLIAERVLGLPKDGAPAKS